MTKPTWSQELHCCRRREERKPQTSGVGMNGWATLHTCERTQGVKAVFKCFSSLSRLVLFLAPLYLTYFHLNELPISCSCCPIIYSSLSHSPVSRTDCQVRAVLRLRCATAAPPTPQLTLVPELCQSLVPQPVDLPHVQDCPVETTLRTLCRQRAQFTGS